MILLCCLFFVAAPNYAKRVIKNPEALGCVNVRYGALMAREVVFADTATTVRFSIQYPPDRYFRMMNTCYLVGEDGRRYPVRSSEGLALDAWTLTSADSTTCFTLHFEPMPKRTQVFDFIENDVANAFMLLGIHDKKQRMRLKTMEELSAANFYRVPEDWFTTDTVTIRGRIEGYEAGAGFPASMECYYNCPFEKSGSTMVADIAADGTFEKKFRTDYPMLHTFLLDKALPGMELMEVYVRPGETIDVTLRKGENGLYGCDYHNGSSRLAERWLKSGLALGGITMRLTLFEGTVQEAEALAEKTWQLLLYRLQTVAAREHFTPMEMQLALAKVQSSYALAVMDYAMNKKLWHEDEAAAAERADAEVLDGTAFYERLLKRVDFDNPLLVADANYDFLVNRMLYSSPLMRKAKERHLEEMDDEGLAAKYAQREMAEIDTCYAVLRRMMGSQDNNLTAQMCCYQNLLHSYDMWKEEEAEGVIPYCLSAVTHEPVRRHAKAYHTYRQSFTEPAMPLPEGRPAELICSLLDRYPGRYLVIDFWGMGCGPCRGAIQHSKELRAEIAKRSDVKLVFIAGERTEGGSEAYRNYVAEWLAGEETLCISHQEFCRLQEYFHFNGIPHYETITPDGRRVTDEYNVDGFHNFDYDMDSLHNIFK